MAVGALGTVTAVGRANNFDSIRFWAALSVLFSHAFSLSYGSAAFEPIMIATAGQTNLGIVAVAAFFVISGYLITQSFERSRNIRSFVRARALRLLPGLIVVLLLMSFIAGPLLTELPWGDYFGARRVYGYVLVNASLLDFRGELPGVFFSNPLPHVNGPLWTLRYEAECYALVLALGVVGLLNRYVTLILFSVSLIYLAVHNQNDVSQFAHQDHRLAFANFFLAGAVVYHWRPPLKWWAAALCASGCVIALMTGFLWLALHTLFAFLVIFAALSPSVRMPRMAKYGDLSYGIYIFHYPVMQIVIQLTGFTEWYELIAVSLPIVLILAFMSWHLVEKVALSHKDRPFKLPGQLHLFLHRIYSGVRASARPARPS
jgi:peptidoglycan/LPS O-acetylase OafA/YrhL